MTNEIGIKTDKTYAALIRYKEDRRLEVIHFIDFTAMNTYRSSFAFIIYQLCTDMFTGMENHACIFHAITPTVHEIEYNNAVYSTKTSSGLLDLRNTLIKEMNMNSIVHGEPSYSYLESDEIKTIGALPVHIKYPECNEYSSYNIITGRPDSDINVLSQAFPGKYPNSGFILQYAFNNKLIPFHFNLMDVDHAEYKFKIGDSAEEYVLDTKADIDIFINNIKTELQLLRL